MFVKNTSQLLSVNDYKSQKLLREIGLNCLENALNAVKPENLMRKSIKIQDDKLIIKDDVFNLKDYDKIYIIGGGKASAEMAYTLEQIISNYSFNYEGIINVPEGLEIKQFGISKKIMLNLATHPIPNENGVKGTKKMLELIKETTNKDLLICLISGGGSALLPSPKNGITLRDLQETNSLLLTSSISIHEINTVRKHLSNFKGGNLAKTIFNYSGATLITLIISDVVGDDLDSIASGPTVPDRSTFKDAIDILKKYDLYQKIPDSVRKLLNKGLIDKSLENPKTNDKCFNKVYNYLIGSVKLAVHMVIAYLKNEFHTNYFSDKISGDANDFGRNLYHIISQEIKKYKSIKKSISLIGSGELTVTIKGKGIGGRNQQALLSFLDFIRNKDVNYKFLIIGANLDGIEGNSKAMGALIDNFTLKELKKKNLNSKKYLDNNDSNSLFKILKSEIITGPTGCNVNDLMLVLLLI
ncbi:MAG: glycerate kinase [Candidatus Odinarchaeota archaeon]